jgi:hypothetical protein
MGRATFTELLHIAAGAAFTVLIFKGAAWAYPLGRDTIELIGWACVIAVVVMGLRPLRRAIAADRARTDG